MAQTKYLLESHLPWSLAELTHQYLVHELMDDFTIGFIGHGEYCLSTNGSDVCLSGACAGNHIELVNSLFRIGNAPRELNLPFIEACRYGHLEIAYLLISHGATAWDKAMEAACHGRQYDMVRMIMRSMSSPMNIDWENCLMNACASGNTKLAHHMFARCSMPDLGEALYFD